MTDVLEKAVAAQAVAPKSAGRDPEEYNGKFTFYTFIVILTGATTGLLLGYDNGNILPLPSSCCCLSLVLQAVVCTRKDLPHFLMFDLQVWQEACGPTKPFRRSSFTTQCTGWVLKASFLPSSRASSYTHCVHCCRQNISVAANVEAVHM